MKFKITNLGWMTRTKNMLFCVWIHVKYAYFYYISSIWWMNIKDEFDDQIINCVSYYILFIKDYSFSILAFIILMCTRSKTSDVLPSRRNKIYFLLLLTILTVIWLNTRLIIYRLATHNSFEGPRNFSWNNLFLFLPE